MKHPPPHRGASGRPGASEARSGHPRQFRGPKRFPTPSRTPSSPGWAHLSPQAQGGRPCVVPGTGASFSPGCPRRDSWTLPPGALDEPPRSSCRNFVLEAPSAIAACKRLPPSAPGATPCTGRSRQPGGGPIHARAGEFGAQLEMVGGASWSVICTPPYVLGPDRLLLLGSHVLFALGVVLLASGSRCRRARPAGEGGQDECEAGCRKVWRQLNRHGPDRLRLDRENRTPRSCGAFIRRGGRTQTCNPSRAARD